MATMVTAAALLVDAESVTPDPEVPQRPQRRRFTREYKLAILLETDSAAPRSIAAILRREGLYLSHLDSFRRQRDAGALNGAVRGRGPKSNPLAGEVAKLRGQNARLQLEGDEPR